MTQAEVNKQIIIILEDIVTNANVYSQSLIEEVEELQAMVEKLERAN